MRTTHDPGSEPTLPQTRWLDLPGAPAIEGLRFRTYQGVGDLPGMVDVANAAADGYGATDWTTVERVAREHAHLTESDPARDCLLATVGETIVAYSRVEWRDGTDGARSYVCFGFVHPGWRRRGIGTAMLAANERRLRQIASSQKFTGVRWLTSWVSGGDTGGRTLMGHGGYTQVRVFHLMVRPDLDGILLPPLPTGLDVRAMTRDAARGHFEALAEGFVDHWGAFDPSEEAFRQWSEDPAFDPSLCVVAFDGELIAGGITCSIDAAENEGRGYQRGWLDELFTRRPWRRRGLASALFGRALVLLKERGMTSAQLGVDAENPNQAVALYERHGFRVQHSSTEWRKPFILP